MKKMILFVIGYCLLSPTFAAQNLVFDNQVLAQQSLTPSKYSFTINYPQIKGPSSPAENDFNRLVKNLAQGKAAEFKKELTQWDTSQLPASIKANGSTLNVNYEITTLEPRQLISIRYKSESFLIGSAHPSLTYASLNYDLVHNKPLLLADLFVPNTDYLVTISEKVTSKVIRKLKASGRNSTEFFKEGLDPTAKNYEVWNITPQGLKFTFNDSQVAPRVNGPQEVTLPFDNLKADIAENSLLTDCLPPHHCKVSRVPRLKAPHSGNS